MEQTGESNEQIMEESREEQSCQGNFDKIATEIDVLIYIYKLLGFMDQLRLARVSTLLRDVFKAYIWKESYRSMRVLEHTNGKLLVLSASSPNWVYLDAKVFEEFLEIYAKDVQELQTSQDAVRFMRMPSIVSPFPDNASDYIDEEEEDAMPKSHQHQLSHMQTWRSMANLKHLSVTGHYMDQWGFDFVATHFPSLESLEIKLDVEKCVGFEDAYSCGKRLLHMKHLKRFAMTVSSPIVLTIAYRIYRDLIAAMDLEYLKIEMALQHQKKFADAHETQRDNHSLKELDIVITSDDHNHSTIIIASCFLSCDNLTQLRLHLLDLTLNEESLDVIGQQCRKLEILHLSKTNVNCQVIKLPDRTQEISLTECSGLTYDNLRQMLCMERLMKFSSLKTRYTGQHIDFLISKSLQRLKCDSVNTRRFMASSRTMCDMKELTWYDPYNITSDAEIIAVSCPHLECLHIECDPIRLEFLSQLPNLHTLSFHHVYALNWSYVEDLLKQLHLDELTISHFYGAEVLDRPVMGFPVSVKTLRINMNMIVQADFWLDLFDRNPKLTLIFFGRVGPFHLKRIFNKSRFPKDLRTIEFTGISINCDALRRNFDETIRSTPFLKDYKGENYIKLRK